MLRAYRKLALIQDVILQQIMPFSPLVPKNVAKVCILVVKFGFINPKRGVWANQIVGLVLIFVQSRLFILAPDA